MLNLVVVNAELFYVLHWDWTPWRVCCTLVGCQENPKLLFPTEFLWFQQVGFNICYVGLCNRNVSNANAVEVLKVKLSFRSSDSSHLV